MRARSIAAIIVGMAALLVVRPSVASQGRVVVTADHASLADDIRAVNHVALRLASVGLSRLGMWNEAAAVSRQLLAAAADPVDACIAQAAVTWQSSQALLGETAFSEWEKLRGMVNDIDRTSGASASEVDVCRAIYRRVTGHLIYLDQSACHNARRSVLTRQRKRLLGLYEAYWAVQARVAAGPDTPRL